MQSKRTMGLETYQKKRDFARTPEPRGKLAQTNQRRFVELEERPPCAIHCHPVLLPCGVRAVVKVEPIHRHI